MSNIVRSRHPRVAFMFDFDETLAPNTTNALLTHLGEDPEHFRSANVAPLIDDGWEQRLAEARALYNLSSDADGPGPITRQTFIDVAGTLGLYPGVEQMFDALTAAVGEIDGELEVEFYLITAGFVHVPEATSIAGRFTRIIGGHWAFDDQGAIVTPKSTVGHYDKVRHIMAIAKGLDSISSDRSRDVDRHYPEDQWYVPVEQIVFVGDGDSDLPAFDYMQSNSGTAIAVHQAQTVDDWESRDDMRRGRQVVAVARSDFEDGSPLLSALQDAGRRAALWTRMLEHSEI